MYMLPFPSPTPPYPSLSLCVCCVCVHIQNHSDNLPASWGRQEDFTLMWDNPWLRHSHIVIMSSRRLWKTLGRLCWVSVWRRQPRQRISYWSVWGGGQALCCLEHCTGKLKAYALCGLLIWLMCIRDGSQSVLTSGDMCSDWLYRALFWSLVSGLGLHG